MVSVGQPVATILGALFNQAGPSGTGGLDLDTGASLGSTNANVEVRDMGIDTALPLANNWRQKIAGVNGTEIRYVKPGRMVSVKTLNLMMSYSKNKLQLYTEVV